MSEIPPPHTIHKNCAFCDRREAEITRLKDELAIARTAMAGARARIPHGSEPCLHCHLGHLLKKGGGT